MRDLLADIADRCTNVQWKNPDCFIASCPNGEAHKHGDRSRSFIATATETRILLYCHTGCSFEEICAAMGFNRAQRALFSPDPHQHQVPAAPAAKSQIVATYDYTDERGKLLFQSVRYEPKTFRQRRPDGNGGWISDLEGVRKVLFNLPEVLDPQNKTILICEGEKDCLAAHQVTSLCATTNPMGAGKWRPEYSESLRGKNCFIIPDNDPVGLLHAEQIAHSLWGIAEKIYVLKLPEGVKDFSDWAAAPEEIARYMGTKSQPWTADVAVSVVATAPEVRHAFAPVLGDLPEECVEGYLGDLVRMRMKEFPLAYAWPAMVTAASVWMETQPEKPVRTNLYTALVGPKHSGKTQTLERAARIIGVALPELVTSYAGSMEQLARELGDPGGAPRLLWIDELAHLFSKIQIDRASFAPILSNMFYSSAVSLRLGRKVTDRVTLRTRLSLMGGIVEERFHHAFSSQTAGGLHDRFLFGLCPGNFVYDFRPFEGEPETLRPVFTSIEHSVWEAKAAFLKENPLLNPRLIEIALRMLVISFSYSGYKKLTGNDLGPAFAFARYQEGLRTVLAPNTGETVEGKLSHLLLGALRRAGKWIGRRELLRQTNAYDYGASVADRLITVLVANGDVHKTKIGKKVMLRYVAETEEEPDSAED